MSIKKSSLLCCLLVLLVSIVAVMGQNASAGAKKDKEDKSVQKIIRLQPTTLAPNSTAIARLTAKMSKKTGMLEQSFDLTVVNLDKGQNYSLFVDGSNVTSREARLGKMDTEAFLEFEFNNREKKEGKKGGPPQGLPSQLDPVTNVHHIEVRDANNQIMLMGDFK